MDLKIGGFYNWKYQRERLIYVGKRSLLEPVQEDRRPERCLVRGP